MKLVIAEKPSVGHSIAAVLGADKKKDGYMEGSGYIVTWCIGHLVGLVNPEQYDARYGDKWSFNTLPIIPQQWKFELNKTTAAQFKVIKELMNDSRIDELITATDAGREGECIFRYVYNYAGCRKPFRRLWISSMEDKAIREGFENLRAGHDYDNLFNAGFARAKADWLVGMNATRLFTCRYGTMLSIGRVQTPTLAMIVKRDYDIENFIKQKYFTVEINCGTFTASSEKIEDENMAKSIAAQCNGKSAVVSSVVREIKTVNPEKLYDLTTLQREANRQFGYTAQQTLDYTQSLYEKKLVTYPRTDSRFLTDDMEETTVKMVDCILNTFTAFDCGIKSVPDVKRCINNKKVSDHHAIIPTENIRSCDFSKLLDGEKNILLLVAARLLTATAAPHKYEALKAVITCENHDFLAVGKTVIEQGFKTIENTVKNVIKGGSDEKDNFKNDEKALPGLSEGQFFTGIAAKTCEHWTSAPKAFTEDTLLQTMETAGNKDYDENSDAEKKGLGTPATRASIIETLVKRGYIERNKKQITSTEKGRNLIEVVPDEVKSPKLTADWEIKLQEIEKGNLSDSRFMSDIESFIKEICTHYSSKSENAAFQNKTAPSLGNCPNCGKEVKKGKYGFYCTGKCGMQLAKVYGRELTESQLQKLLSGKEISFMNNGRKTTVLPSARPYSYVKEGRDIIGFQWETK